MALIYLPIFVIVSIIIFYILDLLIKAIDRRIFYNTVHYKQLTDTFTKEELDNKNIERRYYIIHFFVNCIISWVCFPELVQIMKDPLIATNSEYSLIPFGLVISLHMFHILMSGRYMGRIDWIHHLVNAFIVSTVTIFMYKGKILNFTNFFMCGLPGALDYIFLVLNKYGLVGKLIEKQVNAFQNGYIRAPGIICACTIGYFNYIYKREHNLGFLLILFSLNIMNALFFNNLVQRNYGYYLCKIKLKD